MRHQNTDTNKIIVEESWEDIIDSTRVVKTREEALESVKENVVPSTFSLLKKFWRWNLPLVGKICVILVSLRAIVLVRTYRLSKEEWKLEAKLVQEISSFIGLSSNYINRWHIFTILGVFVRFTLVTFLLLVFRICQRLSWHTSELATFPSVKEDDRYQDDVLLNNAWELASKHGGWKDPTTCNDFKVGIGGGPIVMQPCPGYCGIATLNSTIRSFGGANNEDKAPYLTFHKYRRYVTLEEMVKLIKEVISSNIDSQKVRSKWETGGGSRIDSMQVNGGGSAGFASLEQFRAALRQLSHPTQPARIMAIYHRSPLFFCAGDSFLPKLVSFGMVHWSPVLAYLEREDLVLVMDVNHEYGSRGYLLPTERFYDSVNTRDIFTGNYHGLILIRPPPPKGEMPLLMSPSALSGAFGTIKKAYYQHQAAGRSASLSHILASDEAGYNALKGNEKGQKLIRLVSSGDDQPISAIVSSHPVSFVNEIFLKSGSIPSLDSIRSMLDVCAKLRVPARVAVRGFDSTTAKQIHQELIAVGMVQLMKAASVYFLTLDPSPIEMKGSEEMIPTGYKIEEIIYGNNSSHLTQARDLGKLIAKSYKFPNIIRRGLTTMEFYSQVYETFDSGGGDLRHFACIETSSGELASCVALYCDRSGDGGSRPDVAAIYNVCTSPEHRRKGLGLAMSVKAIEEARKMGCKQVLLEASNDGKPLYQSLGFTKAEEEVGGLYLSLSPSTKDIKWNLFFKLIELLLRIKNGGLTWYCPEALCRVKAK